MIGVHADIADGANQTPAKLMLELRRPIHLGGGRPRARVNHRRIIIADEKAWVQACSGHAGLGKRVVPIVGGRTDIMLCAVQHRKAGKSGGVLASADSLLQVIVSERPGNCEPTPNYGPMFRSRRPGEPDARLRACIVNVTDAISSIS